MGDSTDKPVKPIFGAPTEKRFTKKRIELSSVSPHFQKVRFKVEKLI
jgi:hypothetical protein